MNDVVYTLLAFLFVIAICSILTLLSYFCTKQPNPASQSDGVDGSNTVTDSDQRTLTVEPCMDQTRVCRYPKLLCSSKEKMCSKISTCSSSSSSSCCSICLMDYSESDLLRVLPECGHFFHVKCVDPWFKMHLTCPICRMSVV